MGGVTYSWQLNGSEILKSGLDILFFRAECMFTKTQKKKNGSQERIREMSLTSLKECAKLHKPISHEPVVAVCETLPTATTLNK